MARDGCNCYFIYIIIYIFWAIFCPFTPNNPENQNLLKNEKKSLKISSFYTSVPKNMIR